MPYFLYILICKVTAPFRWLLPSFRNEWFAIRLLFRNDYKVLFITTQSQHETGNYTSAIYLENHNLFGMKKSLKGEYQIGENRGHATYKDVYQSVYDYYHLVTNSHRKPNYGKALNDVPADKFSKESEISSTYLGYVLSQYKSLGYFTGSYSVYESAIEFFAKTYSNTSIKFGINICLALVVPFGFAFGFIHYLRK